MKRRLIRVRILVISVVAIAHCLYVQAVAGAVRDALIAGEPGYNLWWLAIVVDAPVYLPGGYVVYCLSEVYPGPEGFWSYTCIKYLLLIGGTAQWMFIAWVPFLIRDRIRQKRLITGFPVDTE